MADWNLPGLTDLYVNFLTYVSARLNDAATMFSSPPTNQPVGSIRLNRATDIFEEWDGSTWNAVLIGLTGGGTSGSSASTARTGLGLGTIATQDSNAVAITGGDIRATVLDAFSLAATNGVAPRAALGTGGTGGGIKALYDDGTFKTVSQVYAFLAKAANYPITNTDIIAKTIFLCTNAITMTLPTTNDATIDGLPVNVKNLDTANSVTMAVTGGDTIDGASSIIIPPGFSGGKFNFTFVCNKTAGRWEII